MKIAIEIVSIHGITDGRSIDRKIIQRIVTNNYDRSLDRKNYKSIIFEESSIERWGKIIKIMDDGP